MSGCVCELIRKCGRLVAFCCYFCKKKKKKEEDQGPWMTQGAVAAAGQLMAWACSLETALIVL